MSQEFTLYLPPDVSLRRLAPSLTDCYPFSFADPPFEGDLYTLCVRLGTSDFCNIAEIADSKEWLEEIQEWDWVSLFIRNQLDKKTVLFFDFQPYEVGRELLIRISQTLTAVEMAGTFFNNGNALVVPLADIVPHIVNDLRWDWGRASLPELPGAPCVGDDDS